MYVYICGSIGVHASILVVVRVFIWLVVVGFVFCVALVRGAYFGLSSLSNIMKSCNEHCMLMKIIVVWLRHSMRGCDYGDAALYGYLPVAKCLCNLLFRIYLYVSFL